MNVSPRRAHRARVLSFLSALVTLSILLALVACGYSPEKNIERQNLRLGNGAEPQSLDPHLITGVPEQKILSALFEGLVQLNTKTLLPEPAAAASWSVSPDGKTYTFTLRPGLRWSNGDPLTARDFVYSWKRALSPALASRSAYLFDAIRGAKDFNAGKTADFSQVGVKALDDARLEVSLENPTSYFPSMLYMSCFFPVHQGCVEKTGAMDDPLNQNWTQPGHLVSNGPFELDAWRVNRVIRVRRAPNYWGAAAVRLQTIEFLPIDNAMTEERMFRVGDLHKTQTVLPAKVEKYRAARDPRLWLEPYLATYYFKVNTTRPPLNDPRVRRALCLSVNRDALTGLLKGGQKPAYSFTPPGTAGYTCRAAVSYDPAKARQLLAEAGYPGGKGLPPIEILYNTQESHRIIAEAVQAMWKDALGIDVQLLNQDWKVYLDRMKKLDYQVARSGWTADYCDPTAFLDCYRASSGINQTGFASDAYDALLDEAARTLDPARRGELFQKAEALLLNEAPIIPLYHYVTASLCAPELKGYDRNLLDYALYKQMRLEK